MRKVELLPTRIDCEAGYGNVRRPVSILYVRNYDSFDIFDMRRTFILNVVTLFPKQICVRQIGSRSVAFATILHIQQALTSLQRKLNANVLALHLLAYIAKRSRILLQVRKT